MPIERGRGNSRGGKVSAFGASSVEFSNLGDTGNTAFESLREMEKEIKDRQKLGQKRKEHYLGGQGGEKAIIQDVSDLIGKNNEIAIKLLKELVKQDKVSNEDALDIMDEIKKSMVEKDKYLAIQQDWLRDQKEWRIERGGERKDKAKELNLWNVLKMGIRGLIPDEKGKKSRKVFNQGILLLGERFFKVLGKGFLNFVKFGIEAFKNMFMWSILIAALLALLDPNGEFLNAFVETIMAMLPIFADMLTRVIKYIPVFLKRFIVIFAKLWKEVAPVLLGALKEILPMLIDAIKTVIPLLIDIAFQMIDILVDIIPDLLIMAGQLLDDILSAVFGTNIEIFEPLFKFIAEIFQQVVPILVDIMKELIPVILDIMTVVLPPLLSLIKMVAIPLLTFISELIKPLTEMLTGTLTLLKGILTLDPDLMMKGVMALGEGLFKLLFKLTTELLMPILTGNMNKLFGGFGKAKVSPEEKARLEKKRLEDIKQLKSFFSNLGKGMSELFGGIKQTILNFASAEAVQEFLDKLKEKFKDLKTRFLNSGPIKVIMDFIDKMKEGFFDLISIIGGFFKYMGYAFTHPMEVVKEGFSGMKAGIESEAFKIRMDTDIDIKKLAEREIKGETRTQEITNMYQQLGVKPAEVQKQITAERQATGKDVKIDKVVEMIQNLATLQKNNSEKEKRGLTQQGSKTFNLSTEE